jgi:NAD(P)-dependent dehydrogenase (short-subunit alcohol dehydrogenase family)
LIAVTLPWTPDRLGDLTGKRIVVTGATNGVGLGTARALVKAGAHVILAVRNTELGEQRAAEIGGSTSVARVDLADQSSVRAFAKSIDDDIDILINNAGALTDRRTDTVDGFEMTLGTNLLGPFALTNLLLPKVRAQIINVGSDAHRSATLRLDDLHLRRHKWTRLGAYAQSKLAVMLWGLELDRRLRARGSPIVTQLTHPGLGRFEPVADRRLAADGGGPQSGQGGGRPAGQRHRRGRGAHAVLHQRTAAAGQLRRGQRQVRPARRPGADRPVARRLRL